MPLAEVKVYAIKICYNRHYIHLCRHLIRLNCSLLSSKRLLDWLAASRKIIRLLMEINASVRMPCLSCLNSTEFNFTTRNASLRTLFCSLAHIAHQKRGLTPSFFIYQIFAFMPNLPFPISTGVFGGSGLNLPFRVVIVLSASCM